MGKQELSDEQIQKTKELVIETFETNGISPSLGVSACFSLSIASLSHSGASDESIEKLHELLRKAQQEIFDKHAGEDIF